MALIGSDQLNCRKLVARAAAELTGFSARRHPHTEAVFSMKQSPPRSPLPEKSTDTSASAGTPSLAPPTAPAVVTAPSSLPTAFVPAPTPPPARRSAPGEPAVLFGLQSPAQSTGEAASTEHVVEKLRQWNHWVHGAYSANTETAWESDWRGWLEFCSMRAADPLPASPLTVRAYIETRCSLGRRKSTIRRNVATIAAAHAAAGLSNPCDHPAVHLALKIMGRALPGSPRQARGLVWTEIAQFLQIADADVRTVRDRALLTLGYDAMTRREELVAVDCENLTWCADGSARLLIRRSKSDPEGEGSVMYLAPQTARYARTWLEVSGISTGAVFRRVIGRARIGERLRADSVTDVLKRVVARIRLPREAVEATSGHSLRVGATQDLLALNEGLPAIMHTGRWKDARMVEHYGRHLLAGRSAMARAAQAQGRTLDAKPTAEASVANAPEARHTASTKKNTGHLDALMKRSEMTRDRARAFSRLKYYNPRQVLVELRKTELAIARRTDVPDAVKHLRTQELKPLRELREACLFCYGWSQIDGQSFDVAQGEKDDYDAVASWQSDNQLNFAPIQIKEVVPAHLNQKTSVQDIVNKLTKYTDSEDLTVVIHLNRGTPFSPVDLVMPPLKIAALWVFGALNNEQTRWVIWGNFLETPRWGEFSYPE
jgi:site-specific recombinase XerD